MTKPAASAWRLVGFEALVEAWIDRDEPPYDVRVAFWNWLLSRLDDPYVGVLREPDCPDLWHGTVPATRVELAAVHCGYVVDERQRAVVGHLLATLSLPLE